jgi:hypothetical protein
VAIADATLWGFPDVLTNMFLGSGLAMILFTCMIGQLNSQVTASCSTTSTTTSRSSLWVSNAIEFSGLLHSSYLIQMLVAKPSTIESNEHHALEPELSSTSAALDRSPSSDFPSSL